MSTTLNTELCSSGVKLTFPGGRDAGRINYDPDRRAYTYEPPCGDRTARTRNCLEAAQFDALAWASERSWYELTS